MKKTDFKEFEIGTVFNEVKVVQPADLKCRKLKVGYPSRLEAMALDPSKISDNNNLVYEAGQIDFCVNLFKYIEIEVIDDTSDIVVSETSPRKSLIMHAVLLMKKALGFEHGLRIDVKDEVNLKHSGLGSSSSLIAGVSAAINELYGRPISDRDMIRYCAQNHGEEIEGSDTLLVPVQCIGGSAVCGYTEGGLIVLAGQATPIYSYKIPEDIKVVIGVPEDFTAPDSRSLMDAEVDNMEGFRSSGDAYGKDIAYRLVHEVLPGLGNDSLKECKDLIFDYRWDMGSIKNCSFVYPRMVEIAEQMRSLKDDDKVEIISLSSVGPGFFALTKDPGYVKKKFQELKLRTITTSIHNGVYGAAYITS